MLDGWKNSLEAKVRRCSDQFTKCITFILQETGVVKENTECTMSKFWPVEFKDDHFFLSNYFLDVWMFWMFFDNWFMGNNFKLTIQGLLYILTNTTKSDR